MKKLIATATLLFSLPVFADNTPNPSDYRVVPRPANYLAQVNAAYDECSEFYRNKALKERDDANFPEKARNKIVQKMLSEFPYGGYSQNSISIPDSNSAYLTSYIREAINEDKPNNCMNLMGNSVLYYKNKIRLTDIGFAPTLLQKQDFELLLAESPEERQKILAQRQAKEDQEKQKQQEIESKKQDIQYKKYQAEQAAQQRQTALDIYGQNPPRYNIPCDNYAVHLYRIAGEYKGAYHGRISLAEAEMMIEPELSQAHLSNDFLGYKFNSTVTSLKNMIFAGHESNTEIQAFLRNFDNQCLIEYDKTRVIPDSQKRIDYSAR